MDYDLLTKMLQNYRRLYIAEGERSGKPAESYMDIVEWDIDRAILWAMVNEAKARSEEADKQREEI